MPSKEREYREMMLAIEKRDEAEEPEEERMVVTGYASTFDDPYLLWKDADVEVYEQVDRHAFDETDMQDVIMQYDHQGRVFARVRNNTLTVTPDDKGLFISADLSGTDIGRGLYQEIAGGYTDRMSFGFTVDEDEQVIKEDSTTGKTHVLRTIRKVGKLYDVSAVSLPANPGTSISARFLDGAIEEARAERLKAQELREKREQIMKRAEALGKEQA
jgi:HK97 family phage prohead protease